MRREEKNLKGGVKEKKRKENGVRMTRKQKKKEDWGGREPTR